MRALRYTIDLIYYALHKQNDNEIPRENHLLVVDVRPAQATPKYQKIIPKSR